MADRRVWTLCAQMRPHGAEGYPIVQSGPKLDLYTEIRVVPESLLDEANAEIESLIAEMATRD